jgi:putative zinc finger protein
MNQCQRIESLLYLYRDGELSVDEKSKVDEHVKTCARCRENLQQLLSMDNMLVPLRENTPELTGEAEIVNETMLRISRKTARKSAGGNAAALYDLLLGRLRPAMGFTLAAAALLFVVQQSRDTMKVVELEARLRAHGAVVVSESVGFDDIASLERSARTMMPSKPAAASVVADPTALFGSALAGLFQHHPGLIEQLSKRYPDLASVKLDDGIDEHERKILATEGRAFLKDFEQLLNEGVK